MTSSTKKAKLKFLQIPGGEDVLAFLGSKWIKQYGADKNGRPDDTGHYHNLLEIGICRWGRGTVILGKQEMEYTEDTILITAKNHLHNIISNPGVKSYWEFIYINPADFLRAQHEFGKRELERNMRKIESVQIKKQRKEIPLFAQELECLMDQIRTQEYGYRACVKGLVYTLLMEIVKITSMESLEIKSVQNPNWDKLKKIELAMQYVDTHYAEEIRISDIANAAYISESYLRRIFVENYNMSPLRYVNFVRIDFACKILRDQALNINEVAQKVGFDNTSTFIKNFKKIVGKTPKQWRKEVDLNNHTTDAYKNGAQKWWG